MNDSIAVVQKILVMLAGSATVQTRDMLNYGVNYMLYSTYTVRTTLHIQHHKLNALFVMVTKNSFTLMAMLMILQILVSLVLTMILCGCGKSELGDS